MLSITKKEIIEALELSDKVLMGMPKFPGVVTLKMVSQLAGSILIADELKTQSNILLTCSKNLYSSNEYGKFLREGKQKVERHSESMWDGEDILIHEKILLDDKKR